MNWIPSTLSKLDTHTCTSYHASYHNVKHIEAVFKETGQSNGGPGVTKIYPQGAFSTIDQTIDELGVVQLLSPGTLCLKQRSRNNK